MAGQEQQSAHSWIRLWTKLRPAQKTGVVGVALIALILAASPWIKPNVSSSVSLFPEARLQSLELQRLQLAFAQAGLNEFQLRDGQVLVPREQRSDFLNAASKHNALPIQLQPSVDRPPSISPFVSRYQQQLQQQYQKKLTIQEMMRRLKFVAEAWIEFDVDTRSSDREFHPTRCTVSIQPNNDLVLDTTQLETIRNMLKGAVANLRPSEIVIVDLSAGIAYDQQLVGQDPTQAQLQLIERLRLKQKLQLQIREALGAFPTVEIDVAVDEPNIGLPAVDSALSEDFRQTSSDAKSGAMLPNFPIIPGSNGHAVVPLSNLAGTPMASANSGEDFDQALNVGCIRVNLRVPQTLLASLVAAPSESVENDQRAAFERLKTELVGRVRPLLPEGPSGVANNLPITVELKGNEMSAPASSAVDLPSYLASRSGGLVVAVGSVICLALFLSITLLRRSPSSLAPANGAVDVASTVDPDRDFELRLQIDELLKKDPDAAANVIRNWIQKAA